MTIAETLTTNFTVGITGAPLPAFYQWQKNGVDIPGANAATYTTPRLFRTDYGARFRCLVSLPGTNRLSAEAVLTVVPDTNAPQIVSAATLAGSASIGVCFSELLDPVTATNPACYSLSSGGFVTEAILDAGGMCVTLSVSTFCFTNFTIVALGVRDVAGNLVSTDSIATVTVARGPVPVPGVFNTGIDDQGALLGSGQTDWRPPPTSPRLPGAFPGAEAWVHTRACQHSAEEISGGRQTAASAPERAGEQGGGSPLLCGEEPCGIEP